MRRALIGAVLALAACASLPGESADKQYELSLASGAELAMAWHGGPGVENAIFVQKLDGEAKPRGAPVRLTDGTKDAYEPDLQVFGGDMLVAWYEKDKTNGSTRAFLARLNAVGAIVWKAPLDAGGGNARNAVVRVAGDKLYAAWIETGANAPEVFIETFSAQGEAAGKPLRVGAANKDTWNLNATTDAGGVLYLTYDAQLGSKAHELQVVAVDGSAVKSITVSADDGKASLYPDLGISRGGQAALTWFDEKDGNSEVYLATLPLKDLMAGRALPERRITNTAANSIGAYLAWNGDRLALAWCDGQEGQSELYAQTFDASGKPLAGIQRLSHTPAESSIPSIRPWRGGFAIAWNEYTLTSQIDDPTGHASIIGSRAATMVLK
jgi:hypothetical protein